METKDALAALSALAQPHRLAIYRWLLERGPEGAYAGEIADQLGLPATTQSFHLKALQQAGLSRPEPQGRHSRYRAEVSPHYNPWLHAGFVLGYGVSCIALAWSSTHRITPIEWLTDLHRRLRPGTAVEPVTWMLPRPGREPKPTKDETTSRRRY